MEKIDKCSICHREYHGFGNNAWPVNKGRCCNECNGMVVIPARLQIMLRKPKLPAEKITEKKDERNPDRSV